MKNKILKITILLVIVFLGIFVYLYSSGLIKIGREVNIIQRKFYDFKMTPEEFTKFIHERIYPKRDWNEKDITYYIFINNGTTYNLIEKNFNIKLPPAEFKNDELLLITFRKKVTKVLYFYGDISYSAGDDFTRFGQIVFSDQEINGMEAIILKSKNYFNYFVYEDPNITYKCLFGFCFDQHFTKKNYKKYDN